MFNSPHTDWRDLARAASEEMDPDRLMELVEQLNQALDDRCLVPTQLSIVYRVQ